MSLERKRLSFSESGIEKRTEPIPVTSLFGRFNLPTEFDATITELDSKTVVDLDTRALERPDCPLVLFGRPHVGEYVPTDLLERMTDGGARFAALNDRGTQHIFRSANVPSAGFKLSRFVVDPNRAPHPEVSQKAPGEVLWLSPAVDTTTDEVDMSARIYKEGHEPSSEEIRDLVERTYVPYYSAVMSIVGALSDRRSTNERVLMIDGHSFPSIGRTFNTLYKQSYGYSEQDIANMPLFIIGDRLGESCDADISRAFAQAIETRFAQLNSEDQALLKRNFSGDQIVGFNDPFKGVHNVSFFGARERGINALQLELNEVMYADDDGNWFSFRYNNDAIRVVRELIESATMDTNGLLRQK